MGGDGWVRYRTDYNCFIVSLIATGFPLYSGRFWTPFSFVAGQILGSSEDAIRTRG